MSDTCAYIAASPHEIIAVEVDAPIHKPVRHVWMDILYFDVHVETCLPVPHLSL